MLNHTTYWMSRRAVLSTAISVALLTPAALWSAQVHERDATWRAPAEKAARTNPLAQDSDAVAGGAKLFRQRCATCHGDNGRGTVKAPDLTTTDVQSQSDGALFWKITSGNAHAGMPAFSFLPELQRWQLVLHVRAAGQSSRRVSAARNSTT
jgi:mono/diheme cytochrome c family protein